MNRRYLFGLTATALVALVLGAAPAGASAHGHGTPAASVTWKFGPSSPFDATRFDGAFVPSLNRVYFLGFRTDNDATDGSVWYFDVASSTYTDTGVDMPVPISNYEIAELTDAHGLGLYIFGGRDANANIINT